MDRKMFDMSEFYRETRAVSNLNRMPEQQDCVLCRGDNNDGRRFDDCDCALAMVFINMQPLEEIYDPGTAFRNGTLFENLNKPFLGGMRR